MKRKFLALILAALCAATSSVCFTACNTNDDGKGSDNTENTQPEITELQEYDLSGISFNDKSVTYDGNFHSIEIVGELPQGVSVSYTGGGTNAGEYTVAAKFAGDTVTHKPIADITAKLTITKAPFTGEISFSGAQFDYDGEAHNITLTGDLPEGISVAYEYKDENGEVIAPENVKEIGEYTVTAVFTSANYQPISSLTAVLKIVGQTLYDAKGNLNSTLLAKTIVDWLNNTNYYNEIVSRGSRINFNKIDYFIFDFENNVVKFGAYNTDSSSGSAYKKHMEIETFSKNLADKLLNGYFRNSTADEFAKYLDDSYLNADYPFNNRTATNKNIESYSLDDEMSQQDITNMFTMAENILTRLQEVGYQGGDVNSQGTKVTDYDGATILSVRKEEDSGGSSAYYMGPVYSADFYITILKSNGESEIVRAGVSYSTDGKSQNILKPDLLYKTGSEAKWMVRNFSSDKSIDFCPYTENTAQ